MLSKANFQNNNSIPTIIGVISALIFLASIYIIGARYGQNDFYGFFPWYTLAFVSYILLVSKEWVSFNALILMGIIARVSLLPLFPALSDDIYRFYWDGQLTISGINPYGLLPSDVVILGIQQLDENIFTSLNSPDYFTIYPPIAQAYFAVSCLLGNIDTAAIIMKLLLLLTELIGLYYLVKLLKKHQFPSKNAMLFFLNPLIIIEGIGNLHFEVIMISFLCISIYNIFNKNIIYGSFCMAISIGVKLLPLMILPYLFFRMNKHERVYFFGSLLLFCLLIFMPVFGGIQITTFMASMDLYFQKFEFNASIYYVLRAVGQWLSGYNLIKYLGPILGIITIGYNIRYAVRSKDFTIKDFTFYSLIVWSMYLILATTVHPWYVSTILFFTVFTQKRYAILWSYLIFMTYVNYSYPVYYENLWFIAMEYTLLGIFVYWEYKGQTLIQ